MIQENQTTGSNTDFKNFIHTIITHRFFPVAVAILAIVLTLPSLKTGLVGDDYHYKLLMSGSKSILKLLDSPIDMFRFFDGNPQRIRDLKDCGFLPWWTYEKIKGAFWRPLASITHWLDYILWPNSPPLMHLQSLLWYGALVMAVAYLYRRFATTALVAGLASLLYAIDDAHGMPAGFISNRNALMAAFFGVLAVIAHDRWRRDNWRAGIILGPLFLAASLLSAEAGISTCAYLAAYAVFIDRGKWRQRFMVLIPCVAVVLIWRFLWTYLGYGVEDIGGYVDPVKEPLRFASAVKNHAPFLLLGQLALPPSDVAMMLSPKNWILLWRCALIFLVLLAFVLAPLLWRDRAARFWAAGMLLSIIPICATFPSDRLLLFVGIGAMGLVAQLLFVVFSKSQWKPELLIWRVSAVVFSVIFILSHLIFAPLALSFRAANPMGQKKLVNQLTINGPLDSSIRNQDLVVVNPPISFFLQVSSFMWESNNQPVPRHLRVLASSLFLPVKIYRPDAKTLVVRPEYGYYAWVLDAIFRDRQHPFSVGDRVELTGMTVEVTELTSDGRPAEAAFTFAVPLEDTSLRWLQYKDNGFVPFTPQDIGKNVVLQAENLSFF